MSCRRREYPKWKSYDKQYTGWNNSENESHSWNTRASKHEREYLGCHNNFERGYQNWNCENKYMYQDWKSYDSEYQNITYWREEEYRHQNWNNQEKYHQDGAYSFREIPPRLLQHQFHGRLSRESGFNFQMLDMQHNHSYWPQNHQMQWTSSHEIQQDHWHPRPYNHNQMQLDSSVSFGKAQIKRKVTTHGRIDNKRRRYLSSQRDDPVKPLRPLKSRRMQDNRSVNWRKKEMKRRHANEGRIDEKRMQKTSTSIGKISTKDKGVQTENSTALNPEQVFDNDSHDNRQVNVCGQREADIHNPDTSQEEENLRPEIDILLNKIQTGEPAPDATSYLTSLNNHFESAPAEKRKTYMERISNLPIIPLKDGRHVQPNKNIVFFPLTKQKLKELTGLPPVYLSILYKDLQVIDFDMLCGEGQKNLLQNFGVLDVTVDNLIQKHIIPTLEDGTWKEKAQNVPLAYVCLIKSQWMKDNNSVDMSKMRNILPIKTNKGFQITAKETLHFTMDYGNKWDLQKDFPGHDWTVVDSCYLRLRNVVLKDSKTQWRSFLSALGVTDFISVKEVSLILKLEELSGTQWSPVKDKLPKSVEQYHITDFQCPEFKALTNSTISKSDKFQQACLLVRALDDEWDNHFASYKLASVQDENGKGSECVESSFFMDIKHLPWLPANVRGSSDDWIDSLISRGEELLTGKDVHIWSETCERMFANNVPYLATDISSKQFIEDLSLKTEGKLGFQNDK